MAVIHQEAVEIPAGPVIVATGPLTSQALADQIAGLPGLETLNFYDAAAPIVTAESLNMEKIFRQSRYDRGEDYLNCPMDGGGIRALNVRCSRRRRHPSTALRRARCLKAACPWNPWPGGDAWCWLSAP